MLTLTIKRLKDKFCEIPSVPQLVVASTSQSLRPNTLTLLNIYILTGVDEYLTLNPNFVSTTNTFTLPSIKQQTAYCKFTEYSKIFKDKDYLAYICLPFKQHTK